MYIYMLNIFQLKLFCQQDFISSCTVTIWVVAPRLVWHRGLVQRSWHSGCVPTTRCFEKYTNTLADSTQIHWCANTQRVYKIHKNKKSHTNTEPSLAMNNHLSNVVINLLHTNQKIYKCTCWCNTHWQRQMHILTPDPYLALLIFLQRSTNSLLCGFVNQ